MPSLAEVDSSNTHIVTTGHRPLVAAFFAGATGIGHYTLRELCRVTASTPGANGFRAYIVARKPQVVAEVVAECSAIIRAGTSGVRVVGAGVVERDGVTSEGATAEFIFIQTPGLEFMKNVDVVCEEIIELEGRRVVGKDGYEDGEEARIDYLLFTQGCSPYQPRKDTAEGLDFTMAILYYSRMRAILRLLPLLTSSSTSTSSSRHATIVSVYAPGMEDPSTKTFPSNLSLRTDHTYNAARSNMAYMHTLLFESLAAKYPGKLSLTHIFPGLVDGPAFENPDMPAWFRNVWKWFVVPVLGRWILTRAEDCGRRVLGLGDGRRFPPMGEVGKVGDVIPTKGTNGELGGGSYAVGSSADDCFKSKNYQGLDRDEMRRVVWGHTMTALETIEKGQVFRA